MFYLVVIVGFWLLLTLGFGLASVLEYRARLEETWHLASPRPRRRR